MANRITTHILKNSDIVARPLPSSLLKGEAIVNTADGIMLFSGITQSTSGWTQSGPSNTQKTFFEVGSNLYDLKIRNQITSYSGVTNLTGKFLSGTTNGFVLSDISGIAGVDTYVTGGTYNNPTGTATYTNNMGGQFTVSGFYTGGTVPTDVYTTAVTFTNNILTLTDSVGGILTTTINNFSGLTVNGGISATTISATTYLGLPTDIRVTGGTYDNPTGTATFTNNTGGTFDVTGFSTGNTEVFVTGGTPNNSTKAYTFTNNTGGTFTVAGLTDLTITGGTYSNGSTIFTNNTGGTFTVAGYYTGATDVFITGGTANNSTKTYTFTNNTGGTFNVTALTDIYVTGGTLNAGTTTFTNSTGGTFSIAGYNTADTFTTGFTYTPTENKLTISRNQGQPNLDVFVTTVSGLTVSDLTANRLVYTTTAGKLITGTAIFDGTDMSLPVGGSLSVGSGGLSVTGDAIIQGSLTVFGPAISAFTSQLYVEDDNIILNYNPTGSTIATSIGAGLTIQDGNGITGGSVNLDIRAMNTLTGLTASEVPNITEYTGSTGFSNRGWVTQLNDIVIRSSNITTPNGVRVLAEFDILDGGSY